MKSSVTNGVAYDRMFRKEMAAANPSDPVETRLFQGKNMAKASEPRRNRDQELRVRNSEE